jgi:hypothetical protein
MGKMIMQYFDCVGDYLTAYHFTLENGGQLFCGNGNDSANVCLIGKKCYTFWKEGSKRKQEVLELSKYFNIPANGMTGGRIARWLIDSVLCLPYKDTFWGKNYRNLAKSGQHWHYMHCDCNQKFDGVEIDIKSAYFSSLFASPSLLYQNGRGYSNDNNAMELLKDLYPSLPKWFRLQFLGCLASWRTFYFVRDKHNPSNQELVMKCRQIIKYNAAFNVAHRAILRNYKIMQKIHKIGGSHIRRMHTDSFFLDYDIPESVEKNIWDYVNEKNLTYTIKAFGTAYFWDINTGFIGNKFVGGKLDILEKMRRDEVKMKRNQDVGKIIDSEKLFISNAPNLASLLDTDTKNTDDKPSQLSLFPLENYVNYNY